MSVRNEIEKWSQTASIAVSNLLAYKLNFVCWALGPSIVFFLVKYNVWASIYASANKDIIQGYTLQTMLEYQAWVLIVSFLAHGHRGRDIGEDIRLGRISSFLLYPFEFWKYHTGAFIGMQVVHGGIAVVSIVLMRGVGVVELPALETLLASFAVTFVVSLLWFTVQFFLSIMAFWLEETWVLRVMFLIVAEFLSGSIIPLELYPAFLQKLLYATPFPYMTYIPVKIFMGNSPVSVLTALVVSISWLVLFYFFTVAIWKKGIRHYTAAGM